MKYLAVVFFFIVATRVVVAQSDSTIQQKKDSVLEVKLDNQFNKVQQLSAERLADSLKRTDLEKQMSTLTADDHLKCNSHYLI